MLEWNWQPPPIVRSHPTYRTNAHYNPRAPFYSPPCFALVCSLICPFTCYSIRFNAMAEPCFTTLMHTFGAFRSYCIERQHIDPKIHLPGNMSSELFRQPKRTKKYQNKRALIYKRQYTYGRKKSALYQSQVFYSFGPEFGFISAMQALDMTVNEFNAMYGDTLTVKHAILILSLRHYTVTHMVDMFKPDQIRTFYSLSGFIGYYAKTKRQFLRLFNDLVLYHFCNPHGHSLKPTTRVKIFTSMYQKNLQKVFTSVNE